MQFEIYGQAKQPKVVRLNLVNLASGGVRLQVVDENGGHEPGGELVVLHTDGSIHLCNAIDPSIGFELDHRGRLLILS